MFSNWGRIQVSGLAFSLGFWVGFSITSTGLFSALVRRLWEESGLLVGLVTVWTGAELAGKLPDSVVGGQTPLPFTAPFNPKKNPKKNHQTDSSVHSLSSNPTLLHFGTVGFIFHSATNSRVEQSSHERLGLRWNCMIKAQDWHEQVTETKFNSYLSAGHGYFCPASWFEQGWRCGSAEYEGRREGSQWRMEERQQHLVHGLQQLATTLRKMEE